MGQKAAQKLKARLSDLRAAECVEDIIVGGPEFDGVMGQFSIELTPGSYLIVCANHRSVPVIKPGKVDWKNVTRVKLMEIKYE